MRLALRVLHELQIFAANESKMKHATVELGQTRKGKGGEN